MFNKLPLFILVSIGIVMVSSLLGSNFIYGFLDTNLVTLLVALAAINTTTLGVVMTKLREVSLSYHVDFARTIHDMRVSVKEQIILIAGSLVVQIAASSPLVPSEIIYQQVVNILLIAVFIYALYLLYETANMIFVVLEFENEERDMQSPSPPKK